jgi:hypothetical protein
MKIIISEQFLFEDRKQFIALLDKRKTLGKQVKDKDVSNIEEISFSDGYLVLFAKLYFNEIDNQNDGYVATNLLKSLAKTLQTHPNVIKVLDKPLFQYNDVETLQSDIRRGLQLLSARTFYKKIPKQLRDDSDLKYYVEDMARAELNIKEYGVENLVFKKVSRFTSLSRFLDFIDNVINNLSDFENTSDRFAHSRNVELIYKNEEEKILLYVAKNIEGVDLLTDNTVWCIAQNYGDSCATNRNQYSDNGEMTFFRLYNFLSDKKDDNSIGFFSDGSNIGGAYNLADDESASDVDEFLEDYDISLLKHAKYSYEFYEEDENYDDDEDDSEEEEEEEISKLQFKHLAEIFDNHFNTSLIFSNLHVVLTDEGKKFQSFLTATIKGEGDSTWQDMMNYTTEYSKIIEKYFPSKIKVSTKQVIHFFEDYYEGFKFNYRHTGQDLFGDVSTATENEPIEQFMKNLIEFGIPISLNESKIYTKVVLSESLFLHIFK